MSANPAPAPTGAKASTPNVKGSNPINLVVTIFVILVLLIIVTKMVNKHEETRMTETVPKEQTTETVKKVNPLPDYFTKEYKLTKGEVIRVRIPSGYSYSLSGGGKKYYSQPQNTSEPQLRGDGKNHSAGSKVAYTDLSCYENEEITVVCEFNIIQ